MPLARNSDAGKHKSGGAGRKKRMMNPGENAGAGGRGLVRQGV